MNVREHEYGEALPIFNAIMSARNKRDELALEQYLAELWQYANDHNSDFHRAEVYVHRGAYKQSHGRFLDAFKEFFQAKAYCSEQHPEQIVQVLALLGGCSSNLGLFPQAMDYYALIPQYAFSIASDDGQVLYATTLADMAMMQLNLNNKDKAHEYLALALRTVYALEKPEERHLSYILNTHGTYCVATGEYDTALESFRHSLQIKEKINHQRGIIHVSARIADVYFMQGQIEEALGEFLRVYALAKAYKDIPLEISVLSGLIECRIALGDFDTALQDSLYCLGLVEKVDNQSTTSRIYSLLAKVYESMHNYEQALFYHKIMNETILKVKEDQSRLRLEHLTITYDLEHKEQELRVEQLLNEKLRIEVEYKNKELTMLALMLSQRNEMLTKLQQDINRTLVSSDSSDDTLTAINQEISSSLNSEKTWMLFEQQFQTLHHDYIHSLSQYCPLLSPTELKVCAMLKLSMSSKEIAMLLCVETKSIEMYRFRIRKKLNLNLGDNLQVFLTQFSSDYLEQLS